MLKTLDIYVNKINNFIKTIYESFVFKLISKMIKKYDPLLYIKDPLGIISRINYDDNLPYVFKHKNPSDAFELMNGISKLIRKSNISFDIGASSGITTVWMSRFSNKVYAFEPESKNLKRLSDTVKVNGCNNVQIVKCGISNNEGTSILNVLSGSGHHSLGSVKTSENIGTQKIPLTTIDKFCYKNQINMIDYLQIDVEGYEYEVLKGASAMLSNKRIKNIVFEVSSNILRDLDKDSLSIYNYLKKFEYKVRNLDGKIINKNQYMNLSSKSYDFLATSK